MAFKNFTTTTRARMYIGSCSLSKLVASNPNSGDVWVYAYNANEVGDVTIGTTVPVWQMLVPGGSSTSRGFNEQNFSGLTFKEGLVIGVRTTAAAAPGTALEIQAIYG